ncbi:hypothetical protein E2P86_06470 [Sphingobacterium psychroaquaticum]|uniref:hypothetical protein n=1 Tax=Sphingobacterium psychroaquaticum TaxID=561061 RepID=UPI00106A8A95|nr:hypothetical protein [Sphingobacterium psychroaquaticum]QBQ40813.1 hypothetical protein E2P86_06470 [Sphingobacterium psychroaquaticum]
MENLEKVKQLLEDEMTRKKGNTAGHKKKKIIMCAIGAMALTAIGLKYMGYGSAMMRLAAPLFLLKIGEQSMKNKDTC